MANGDLINFKHCRDFALGYAERNRKGWKPKRVSKKFLNELNASVRHSIEKAVASHPSVGKTIMDFL